MSIDKIIELTNASPSGSSGSFDGNCLAHSDKKKSLSIGQANDGKILLKCHAGCSQEDVINSFKEYDAWPYYETTQIKNKQLLVQKLWDTSDKIINSSIADKYFKSRGLLLDKYPNSLRYSSSCYNSETRENTHAVIAKIQNLNGEIIGLQRIYLNENGNKLKVESPKKILGSCSGGYVELSNDTCSIDVIHIVEGIETGLAIYSSFNETVLCSVSAINLSKIPTAKTSRTYHIWADNDKSGTGQREAEKAAKKISNEGSKVFLHLPKGDIPEGSKGVDYLDVYVKNPKEILEEKNSGKEYSNAILPIKMPKYDLPKPNDQYFPLIIRDWVFNQADRLNVAPETTAVPLFSILGSLLGVKLAIQPKRNDHWTVFANLWGIIIAPPGTKKSAILNTSVKILNQIEFEENKKAQAKASEFVNDLQEISIKMIELKKKLKEAIKADDHEEKIRCRKELSEFEKKESDLKVSAIRYSTSAFSIEKLMDMLADNPNGLLISRDEISGIFDSFSKKGQETTRQFLLEGWNGDGSFSYDILSRPSRPLENICLTILGGTQPTVINKMLSDMRADHNDDGFIQRFQLIAYPNQDLKPEFVDKSVNQNLQDKVKILLETICNLDCSQHGEKQGYNKCYVTKLAPDAYARFATYMGNNEKEIHLSENNGYKNHISKFGKLLSGLILIFHVIDNIETNRTVHKAPLHVVEMAILWCDLFKAHAKKLYDTEYNFESLSGFALAKKIHEKKVHDGSSLRAIYHNGWSNLKSPQEAESACKFLEKHNWLSLVEDKPKTGRSSFVIKFNVKLVEFLKNENWCG